ncbi:MULTISPECIES: ferredoxin [unclassified Gemella]|uniref:ferredoxin n=1 Tax=unclassified Gemella TaxID=2624949 RepID=UPI001C04911E|nr:MULTISPECIES: ferredoxin [unclassified Gemella]MBU0278536.1 ferredoxin [Gemella sp. zg-1178]QWQ39429.1 ferredoxin [Gemella sp. zg-570]
MRTKVNRETCISCGNCYSICPEIYECDEDGIAFCKLDNNKMIKTVDDKFKSLLLECYDSCPTESIIIENIESR